eukprot:COSAG01_NODE_37482_length_503_cov_0.586634_1_plen_74_part_10
MGKYFPALARWLRRVGSAPVKTPKINPKSPNTIRIINPTTMITYLDVAVFNVTVLWHPEVCSVLLVVTVKSGIA